MGTDAGMLTESTWLQVKDGGRGVHGEGDHGLCLTSRDPNALAKLA